MSLQIKIASPGPAETIPDRGIKEEDNKSASLSSVTLTKTVFLVFQNRLVAFLDDAVATPRGITVSTLSYDPCGGESGFVG